MKERPIIFNSEMIRAILDGKKTQTRRVIKPQTKMVLEKSTLPKTLGKWFDENAKYYSCPYGKPGDRLWVRETFCIDGDDQAIVFFKATDSHPPQIPWKPSIHMPRGASRILLEITDIRVEHVQDISEKEVIKEGLTAPAGQENPRYIKRFAKLWDSINKKRGYGWDMNLWVWIIEFKRS